MKNFWKINDGAILGWQAELSAMREQKQKLQEWLTAVIEIGERAEAYIVEEAPQVAYERDRDGSFVEFLNQLFLNSGKVNLLYFADEALRSASDPYVRVRTRMSYNDRSGNEIEGFVDDLVGLRKETQPGVVFGRWRQLPIEIISGSIVYRDPQGSKSSPPRIHVEFIIGCNIWLPWVQVVKRRKGGGLTGKCAIRNTLALRHTPRLNAFLSQIGETTRSLGGQWNLTKGIHNDSWLYCADENGIRLDAPIPEGWQEVQPDDPNIDD
jgi:hypothetical protein